MTATAIHRYGPHACGGVAFHYDTTGNMREDMIEAERVTLPGGKKPGPGDTMTCGKCGLAIDPRALDFVPGHYEDMV